MILIMMNRSTACRFTIDIVKDSNYSKNKSFINICFYHNLINISAPNPFFYLSNDISGGINNATIPIREVPSHVEIAISRLDWNTDWTGYGEARVFRILQCENRFRASFVIVTITSPLVMYAQSLYHSSLRYHTTHETCNKSSYNSKIYPKSGFSTLKEYIRRGLL